MFKKRVHSEPVSTDHDPIYPSWYNPTHSSLHTRQYQSTLFSNGEVDLWPVMRNAMPNGASIDSKNKQRCEDNRQKFTRQLLRYAFSKKYGFEYTDPEYVTEVAPGTRANDIWAHRLDGRNKSVIVVPRHVVTDRQKIRKTIPFRSDVPAYHILGSMAHEITHGDRAQKDLGFYSALYSGFGADRSKVDLSTVEDEEFDTDIQAFSLLRTLGIPFSPYDYADTIPISTGFHSEFLRSV